MEHREERGVHPAAEAAEQEAVQKAVRSHRCASNIASLRPVSFINSLVPYASSSFQCKKGVIDEAFDKRGVEKEAYRNMSGKVREKMNKESGL